MNKKCVFLDIDGTLTPAGSNRPPESALRAVRAARAKGHAVFLCTGRNPDMLGPVLAYGFDGAVACAGGRVFAGDRVLFRRGGTYDCTLTVSDSIIVMCEGEIVAYFPDASTINEQILGEYMLGLKRMSPEEIGGVCHE